MTGQFHLLPHLAAAGGHEHISILLDNQQSLRYRDARCFGYVGILSCRALMSHSWFASLGPEPLGDDFHPVYLLAHCRARKGPIKNVLMDGHVVVGVGNIYAAESLFRAGIHPARAAGRIAERRIALLVDAIRGVLSEAIAAGGSTISDFVRTDGRPGYFSHAFQVYGRVGKACFHCGSTIRRIQQSGRSTFYCPRCQR